MSNLLGSHLTQIIFKKGEDELNKAIEMGYKVITDYPTSTGVVFSIGLYDTQEEII